MQGYSKVVGIDEAGRGPLAGPVVAAACHLGKKAYLPGIDDSKQLTAARREEIYSVLTAHPEVKYGIGIVDCETIDRINILQATKAAMMQAVKNLPMKPDYLLVDGLDLADHPVPSEKIIKGDTLSLFIGAASILAKVTRDRLMDEYHKKWPQYGFDTHRGYGTQKHRQALEEHGPCPIHRKTFEPVKSLTLALQN